MRRAAGALVALALGALLAAAPSPAELLAAAPSPAELLAAEPSPAEPSPAELPAAAAPRGCAPDLPSQPSCARLRRQHQIRHERLGARCVSVRGAARRVRVLAGAPPARAAAALLAALLRHVLRYARLRTEPAPHDTARLARSLTHEPAGNYSDLVVAVSTAWVPAAAPAWEPGRGMASGLAGPRLDEFGRSAVPARCALHARRAPAAPALCSPYAERAALAPCGFALPQGNASVVELLVAEGCASSMARLAARDPPALPLSARAVTRAQLLHAMRTATHSFLFLDYEIWEGEPSVSVVEPPPCVSLDRACPRELDPAIAMRVADVELLRAYGPRLFQFIHDYEPTLLSLRTILEQESNGTDIDEAACGWILNNVDINTIKTYIRKYDVTEYSVTTYLCEDDPDLSLHYDVLRKLGPHIYKDTIESRYTIKLTKRLINCSDAYQMSVKLEEYSKYANIYNLMGVVSQSVEGAGAAAAVARALRVPLVLAGAAPRALAPPAWRAAAEPQHAARALARLVRDARWTRLAVLSQPTALARHYYAALRDNATFAMREYSIPLELDETRAREVLQRLRDTNARIVFVNAEWRAAAVLLAAAHEARMSYAEGFVWIARDWRADPAAAASHTTHFTVSPWSRGKGDLPVSTDRAGVLRAKNIKADLNTLWSNRTWPSHAASLVNALLTLTDGFKNVFGRYPETRQDLHSDHAIRSLNESLVARPVVGVDQVLRFKEHSLEEATVYVDRWRGGELELRLASWSVRVRGDVRGPGVRAGLPRADGARACLARGGDAFAPACYDAAAAALLLLLALAPPALLLARRRRARRRLRRELERVARRRRVASALAAWLVERDALELRHELGAGRFGSVRLALLRAPARAPRYIAAKALRDDAAPTEESEFLREACTIASLDHEHIVRLIGVCIKDGPPLVLMELAFFGDLLGYLRARRHLVDGSASEEAAENEEAAHVSAEALTRLAREAAEALQYLSARGVVHRDVRAANCLVDARRSLKLADFGMARETAASADGAAEYACRRRGLFPVLWMAPESLERGVFSAASDVWALGVLMLELVTLGARPYGSMSPLRVLEYVAAGGCPPLPLDATPQTRALARLCWARQAARRPRACALAAWLAARPLALRPALLAAHRERADADSGFEESPSTELLPPDSPLHSFDQFEELAASH